MPKMSPEDEQVYNYQWRVAPYDTPEGRANAPQWLRDRFGEGAARPANSRRAAPQGPTQRFLSNWAPWGIGTFLLGIVMVIIAIVLHDHYALQNAACQSAFGELGQAFSGTTYYGCSTAATAEQAVGYLVFFGVAALLIGGGKMVMAIAGAALLSNEQGKPASGQAAAASARPATATTWPAADPRPVINGQPATNGQQAANGQPAAGVRPVAGVPPVVSSQGPRLFCTKCGTRGEPGDKFCGSCGAQISSATPV